MTPFKLHRITRSPTQDLTEFTLLGQQYRVIARPRQQWQYFHWGRWEANEQRRFAYQTPWISLIGIRPLNL